MARKIVRTHRDCTHTQNTQTTRRVHGRSLCSRRRPDRTRQRSGTLLARSFGVEQMAESIADDYNDINVAIRALSTSKTPQYAFAVGFMSLSRFFVLYRKTLPRQ